MRTGISLARAQELAELFLHRDEPVVSTHDDTMLEQPAISDTSISTGTPVRDS